MIPLENVGMSAGSSSGFKLAGKKAELLLEVSDHLWSTNSGRYTQLHRVWTWHQYNCFQSVDTGGTITLNVAYCTKIVSDIKKTKLSTH